MWKVISEGQNLVISKELSEIKTLPYLNTEYTPFQRCHSSERETSVSQSLNPLLHTLWRIQNQSKHICKFISEKAVDYKQSKEVPEKSCKKSRFAQVQGLSNICTFLPICTPCLGCDAYNAGQYSMQMTPHLEKVALPLSLSLFWAASEFEERFHLTVISLCILVNFISLHMRFPETF